MLNYMMHSWYNWVSVDPTHTSFAVNSVYYDFAILIDEEGGPYSIIWHSWKAWKKGRCQWKGLKSQIYSTWRLKELDLLHMMHNMGSSSPLIPPQGNLKFHNEIIQIHYPATCLFVISIRMLSATAKSHRVRTCRCKSTCINERLHHAICKNCKQLCTKSSGRKVLDSLNKIFFRNLKAKKCSWKFYDTSKQQFLV